MSTQSTGFVDYESRIPNSLDVERVEMTEVVAVDPETERFVRFSKRELLAWKK